MPAALTNQIANISHFHLNKAYCINDVVNIKPIFLSKHYLFKNKIYCSYKTYLFIFGVSHYSYKGKLFSFIVKEIFIEIGFKEV